jgi:glycerophosphoryl diester phosphodiesterase
LPTKSKNQVEIGALISHRFRGFSAYENTIIGLCAALDFGVLNLEFDVRMAKCGTPMIYHDEFALDGNGDKQYLCDHKASEYADLGGRFESMPTLDALFSAVKVHKNQSAKLLIDIKDLGFEHEIHALVMVYRLHHRAIYVSWVPEVLYRIHGLAPSIPLCLSHWCGDVSKEVAASHDMHISTDGIIPRLSDKYMTGVRYGWISKQALSGDMLDILKHSGGGICVPQFMLTRELSDFYHGQNLFVSTFSYTDWTSIHAHKSTLEVDLYFIDNKQVFDELG